MEGFTTISNALARRRDALLLIRLGLAGAVFCSHAFVVARGLGYVEPLKLWTGLDLGQHAVNLFFVLSGFLVVQSLERRDTRSYLRARALRIFPGLIVAALVAALIIGPLMSHLGVRGYFGSAETWRFLPEMLPRFNGLAELPGVFNGHPVRNVMATIWTIKYEIVCYILLALAGAAGLLRRPLVVVVSLGVGLAALMLFQRGILPAGVNSLLRFGTCFMLGNTFWLLRRRIPLNGVLAVCLGLVAFAADNTPFAIPSLVLAEGYGLLWLAYLPLLARVPAPSADLSYGIYLYGFPIEQVVEGAGFGGLLVILVAAPVTLAVAALSWFLVEKPALQFKEPSAHAELPRPAESPAS
jgi:peptidoglycan/LPS O-acetylase OafA/YrhL